MSRVAEQYRADTLAQAEATQTTPCGDCGGTDEHTPRCPMWRRYVNELERGEQR